jgi:hypothetical protein
MLKKKIFLVLHNFF